MIAFQTSLFPELESPEVQISPKSQTSTLIELQCSTKRAANPNRAKRQGKLPYQHGSWTADISEKQGKKRLYWKDLLSIANPKSQFPLTSSKIMLNPLQPQPKKRSTPCVGVTTISPLMAEEKPCYYAPWFRSQYQIPSKPSDYDTTDHDEMVIQCAVELQDQGYQITVETANSIKVVGQKYNICLAGCPDIIAIKDDLIIIEDCKSGKKRASHRYQVLLYMMLLRYAENTKAQCKDKQILGRLIYPDEIQDISEHYLDPTFYDKLHQILATLTSPEIPTPQANPWNCRYCALPDQYCSIKMCA